MNSWKNQHIDINLINGGRIESASKMVFGNADYFNGQGGSNNGHMDGIEVAMTIDGGAIDLTLQTETQDYFADYGGAVVDATCCSFTNIIKPAITMKASRMPQSLAIPETKSTL